jgi:hypothetical protein
MSFNLLARLQRNNAVEVFMKSEDGFRELNSNYHIILSERWNKISPNLNVLRCDSSFSHVILWGRGHTSDN